MAKKKTEGTAWYDNAFYQVQHEENGKCYWIEITLDATARFTC